MKNLETYRHIKARGYWVTVVLVVLLTVTAISDACAQRHILPIRGLNSNRFFNDRNAVLNLLGDERFTNPNNNLYDEDYIRFERVVNMEVNGPVEAVNIYLNVMKGRIKTENVERGRLYKHVQMNDDGTLKWIALYNISNKVEFMAKFKYRFDGLKIIEIYREDGTLWSSMVYRPDSLLSEDKLYKRNGKTTYTRKFEYDDDGRIQSSSILVGDDGNKLYAWTYQYNPQGYISGRQEFKDGKMKYWSVHDHDDAGNMILYKLFNHKEKPVYKFSYEFDDTGNLLKRNYHRMGDKLYREFEYEYDEQNHYVSSTRAESGVIEFLDVVTYDGHGHVIDSQIHRRDTGPMKLTNHLHITRGEYGNPIRSEVFMEPSLVTGNDYSSLARRMYYPEVSGKNIFTYEYVPRQSLSRSGMEEGD